MTFFSLVILRNAVTKNLKDPSLREAMTRIRSDGVDLAPLKGEKRRAAPEGSRFPLWGKWRAAPIGDDPAHLNEISFI